MLQFVNTKWRPKTHIAETQSLFMLLIVLNNLEITIASKQSVPKFWFRRKLLLRCQTVFLYQNLRENSFVEEHNVRLQSTDSPTFFSMSCLPKNIPNFIWRQTFLVLYISAYAFNLPFGKVYLFIVESFRKTFVRDWNCFRLIGSIKQKHFWINANGSI